MKTILTLEKCWPWADMNERLKTYRGHFGRLPPQGRAEALQPAHGGVGDVHRAEGA